MSTWSRHSLGVPLVLWLLLISQVKNEGKLDIWFIRYSSDGRVPSGYCCEAWVGTPCSDACDPMFTLCVEDPRESKPCSLYKRTTEGMDTGSNDVVFGNSIQGTLNPFIIQIHKAVPSSIKIQVTVHDDDLASDDDYMDTLATSINISVSPNKIMSPYMQYYPQGRTKLEMSVRAYCDPDWYGSDCLTYCKASTTDHYSCQFLSGAKMCSQGWKGDNCDQDINECTETADLCQHDGSCTNTHGSFQCQCVEGITGRNCELVTNHCALNRCLNGGTCDGNETDFSCTCPFRWSGETCAERINCDSAPCDWGKCIPKPETPARFKCDCDFPWTGDTCDMNVDITNITVLGVIDDNNRGSLTTGLRKIINYLGGIEEQINVVVSTHINSESINVTTQVQFYVTLETGTFLTSDFVREIFSSNSYSDINQHLPTPLYTARDTDKQEADIITQEKIAEGSWFKSNWYKVVGPLSAGPVLVALCVAFLIYRRKSHESVQLPEDNPGNIIEMDVVNRTVQDKHRRTTGCEEDARASTEGYTRLGTAARLSSRQEVTSYIQPIHDTLPGENHYSHLATTTPDNSSYATLGSSCQKGSDDHVVINDVNVDGATEDHPYEDIYF
ncbi:delta-like protein 1 [Haliotis rubra]|uniref:delta-like protein 1 n=1 Tax=Haliotis rubra TaxID=36100 RepID=UPI001EE5D48B|nr:delta-like protein 1 [Haliotis rubra]